MKLLVLGFSLPSGLFADIEARTLGRYWRHTLTKAVAGREISQRFWHIPGDDAFIAGLLQDLGILLLLQQLGEPLPRFLDRVLADGLDTDRPETEALGFTHTALGATLAQWHLPANLVEAIAADPRQPPADASPSQLALPKILHMAELVARLLADGQTGALAQLLDLGQDYRQLPRDELGFAVERSGGEGAAACRGAFAPIARRRRNTLTFWPRHSGNWPASQVRRLRTCCGRSRPAIRPSCRKNHCWETSGNWPRRWPRLPPAAHPHAANHHSGAVLQLPTHREVRQLPRPDPPEAALMLCGPAMQNPPRRPIPACSAAWARP